MAHEEKTYFAPPVLSDFLRADSPQRFVRGPIGSGKSVACAIELIRRASQQAPGPDGIRRTRAAIIRNTLSQLKSTCLVTLEEWLRPITHFKVSDTMVQVRAGDIHLDILLLPLDTPQNIQRLLSLELTFAWCSEVREIPLEIVQSVYSRCGRYPSKANGGPTWYGLWAETNSFSEDSEYFEFLEVDKPDNVSYFVQPGAMEPDAENRENLPPNYYEDMVAVNTDHWVDQYVHNKIGPSLSGQAVFARSFDYAFHTAEKLYPDYSRPLVIGLDTGRQPAAVVGQLDAHGRLLVFASVFAENMGMEQFLTTKLRPLLAERFQGGSYWIAVDPAARQRSQVGEESVLEAIKRLGFAVVLAPTNNIAPRLRAVERYMSMQIGGKAGFLVDRGWCQDLLKAIQYGYRYSRDKQGALAELPEKSHPDSDLCDGMQYLCLSASSNVLARALSTPMRVAPKPSKAAWT